MSIHGNESERVTTIRYKMADGCIINVEVSVSVKEALELSDRHSKNLARKERWHFVTLRPNDFFDSTIGVKQDGFVELIAKADDIISLKDALMTLPSVQQRRLLLYFNDELTYQDIAKKEHVSYLAVWKSIKAALQTLREILAE